MPQTPNGSEAGLTPAQAAALGTKLQRQAERYANKHKPKKHKHHKGRKPKHPKALHVHATAGAGSAGRSQAGAGGPAGSAGQAAHTSSAHAGAPAGAWVLAGSGTGGSLVGADSLDRLPGISGVLLDLVGEGRVGLSHALSAWQREQERVANRTWRRPGGLARMGGL